MLSKEDTKRIEEYGDVIFKGGKIIGNKCHKVFSWFLKWGIMITIGIGLTFVFFFLGIISHNKKEITCDNK